MKATNGLLKQHPGCSSLTYKELVTSFTPEQAVNDVWALTYLSFESEYTQLLTPTDFVLGQ